MSKKIVLCIGCFIILTVIYVFANVTADIEQAKTVIKTYITAGKDAEAAEAYQKFIVDFAENSSISAAVYDIAETYRDNRKFSASIAVYKDVVNKWPASRQAVFAQRGVVISSIALGRLTDAQAELDNLKKDYSADPDITEAVFNVGDTYYWFGKYSDANTVYEYVLENWPKSDYAMWATMGLAISSIASKDDTAAEGYIEKLKTGYADNLKLPEALFYIAGRLGYDKKYEKADEIYGKIISDWPESEWGKNAVYESAKLGVYSYLDKNDEPNTLSAIDLFIVDFNDRLELPADVLGIAARADSANQYGPNDLTKEIYYKFIDNFPTSPQIVNAQMALARMEIISLMDANDDPNAFAGIDGFIADFNSLTASADEVFRISLRYYNKAMQLKHWQKDAEGAAKYFYNAIEINGRIIKDLPQSSVTSEALFGIGVMYGQELEETEKGIEAFEELFEKFPEHNGSELSHLSLARFYNVLKKDGKIDAADADEKIEKNLTVIVEKYPDDDMTPHVALQLAQTYFGKGQWQQAAAYYEIYLAKFPDQLRVVVWPLGQSYEKMGEPEAARQLYQAYISSADPNDAGLSTIKARLDALGGKSK